MRVYLGRVLNGSVAYCKSTTEYGGDISDIDLSEYDVFNLGKTGYEGKSFNAQIGFPETMPMYDVYFATFGQSDGVSGEEMLRRLCSWYVFESEDVYVACIGATYCCFRRSPVGVERLFNMQRSVTKYDSDSVSFLRRLESKLASLGYSRNSLRFLFWEGDSSDLFLSVVSEKYFVQFLNPMYQRLDGFKRMSRKDLFRTFGYNEDAAWTLVSLMSERHREFKFSFDSQGCLQFPVSCRYDYSSDRHSVPRVAQCGIVIDCEGSSYNNGVDEVGGVIFAYSGFKCIPIRRFYGDSVTSCDAFISAVEETQGYCNGIIDVITYGNLDERLLRKDKRISKKVFRNLNFIDIRPDLVRFCESRFGSVTHMALSDMASLMGVAVIKPLHNPMNDARILYNMLARMRHVLFK